MLVFQSLERALKIEILGPLIRLTLQIHFWDPPTGDQLATVVQATIATLAVISRISTLLFVLTSCGCLHCLHRLQDGT